MVNGDAPALDRAIIADAMGAGLGCPCDVLVIDDSSGALTAGALEFVAEHRHSDEPPRVLLYSRNANHARARRLEAERQGHGNVLVVAGVDTEPGGLEEFLREAKYRGCYAFGRLPKSLRSIDDTGRALARHAAANSLYVELILGGQSKHMSRSMNSTLSDAFDEVTALRGHGKFRSLHASGPRTALIPHTAETSHGLHGLGGVFSGGKPDRGGEALAQAALAWCSGSGAGVPTGISVLDLGCGNGSVSKALLDNCARDGAIDSLIATDVDLDAARSTKAALTPWLDRSGGQDSRPSVAVEWDDAASKIPTGSIDLVLLNPPFHAGTRVDPTLVAPLLDAAQRVLAPNGHIFFVHNSHLRYRALLESRFSGVEQVSRNQTFTVLLARR